MAELTILGHIGRDIELKTTSSGKVYTNISIAERISKDKTQWINATAWEKTAEFLQQYSGKGLRVLAKGEFLSSEKDGKTYWNLTIEKIKIIDFKDKNQQSEQQPQHQTQQNQYPTATMPDDDLPF